MSNQSDALTCGYLEGRAAGRSQGVVYGEVLRRATWQGRIQLVAPEKSVPLLVVALSGDKRVEVQPDRASYQLVLPPGPAMLWAELDGRRVMEPVKVDVADGGEHRTMIVVEYPGPMGR